MNDTAVKDLRNQLRFDPHVLYALIALPYNLNKIIFFHAIFMIPYNWLTGKRKKVKEK